MKPDTFDVESAQISLKNNTSYIILLFILTGFYVEKLIKQSLSEEVWDEIKTNEISRI